MYNVTVGAGGVAGASAGLGATGLTPMAIVWTLLAAFALLSVGGAMLRVAPSLHRSAGAPVRRAALRPRRR